MVRAPWDPGAHGKNPGVGPRNLKSMVTSITNATDGTPESKYEILPKSSFVEDGEGELLEVAMGPQHPSTHGVFRMDVVLDGERVIRLKPVFGYLHRNHEKIGESTSYLASMPY